MSPTSSLSNYLTGSYDNTEAINISEDGKYQCVDDLLKLIFLTNVLNTHQLKFSDLKNKELLHIYALFVRSATEYCSVDWHNNLTQGQNYAIEQYKKF